MPDPDYTSVSHVGVDISKDSFDVCLLHTAGTSTSSKFSNDSTGFRSFLKWLNKHASGSLRVGLESTGSYGIALLNYLFEQDIEVALLNPRQVKNFTLGLGNRVKTDQTDAAAIALFMRSIVPKGWSPMPMEVKQLQYLMRRREQLVVTKQAASNRIAALRITKEESADFSIGSVSREIEFLVHEIQIVDDELSALVRRSVAIKKSEALLRTIPGIGRIVALTILSEIPFILSFSRAREAAAFAGLTPSLQQSGSSVRRRGNLSKAGSSTLRKQLYMAALNAVRRESPLTRSYASMVERGKPKKVALAALMHKILRIAYGVLKHETAFAPQLA